MSIAIDQATTTVHGHALMSAYACMPGVGSEPSVGWNWLCQMSRYYRLSVLTRMDNRGAIETWLRDHRLPNVTFHYVDVPKRLQSLRPTTYPHYIAWQWAALQHARRILAVDSFELAHHATYVSVHMPIFLQHLPVPLVYGPVAGGEGVPRALWGSGARAFLHEVLRLARMRSLRWDPFVQHTLRKAARILVTTPETAAYIPEAYRAKTSVMLAAGIEHPEMHEPRNGASSRCRIYAAGRLLHWKGFHLAIKAFAKIAQRHPHATFTIVGDGPYRAALSSLIKETGLDQRVVLEHWLPRETVLKLAAESDIFVFPSFHDSGGIVVLEAMAAATPVVCLDVGGPGVMITPETGIAVAPTTPDHVVDELARALDRLVSDPVLRHQMGQRARQRVLNEYVWERKSLHMKQVYDTVSETAVLHK